MKKILQLFSICCAAALMGCHTSQKATVHHSRQPHFIEDIYLDGHNSSSATRNGISRYQPAPPPSEHKIGSKVYASTDPKMAIPPRSSANDPLLMNNTVAAASLKEKYAMMMNISSADITNYPLYRFIEEWYGTDYQRGGQDKDGIDCSAFVQKLYSEVFGVDLLRTSFEQFKNCEHLHKPDEAMEGDLVFFKIRSKHITHVGVYLGNNYFVHASSSQGVTISNLNEEYWKKYFAGIGHVARG